MIDVGAEIVGLLDSLAAGSGLVSGEIGHEGVHLTWSRGDIADWGGSCVLDAGVSAGDVFLDVGLNFDSVEFNHETVDVDRAVCVCVFLSN